MTRRMLHRRLGVRRALLLLTVLALTVGLTGCGFRGLYAAPLPGGADLGSHPYHVTVKFEDVLDLVPQSAVKVNDVAVGRVEKVSLEDWHASVDVVVRGDVSLPANATAQLRQTSLLGEKFVSLEQPDSEVPTGRLGNHSVIPLNRTGRNPEVEEVLGALSLLLNGGGLEQIRIITHELNNALSGRSAAVRSLITQLNTFVGGLDQQKTKITTALDRLNVLAKTLADQKNVLARTLDSLPGAVKILADERVKLVGLLKSLDGLSGVAVRVINASKDDTVAALRSLNPVLTQLTAAGQDLPKSLELLATYPFPRTATNAVRGDYTNLNATLDLDLGDVLSNLDILPGPAPTGGTANGATQSSTASQLPGGSPVPGVRMGG